MRLWQTVALSVALAAPISVHAGALDGFYGGAALGYADVSASGTSGDGEIFGVFGGYNYTWGATVVGGELSYDTTNIDLSGGGSFDEMLRLKGRVGTEIGDGLLYGTLGYVRGYSTGFGDDDGWLYGFGYDYNLSDTTFIGAEYLRQEFDSFGSSGLDFDVDTYSLRVGFRF
jgi:outer membrane immunogenic protein